MTSTARTSLNNYSSWINSINPNQFDFQPYAQSYYQAALDPTVWQKLYASQAAQVQNGAQQALNNTNQQYARMGMSINPLAYAKMQGDQARQQAGDLAGLQAQQTANIYNAAQGARQWMAGLMQNQNQFSASQKQHGLSDVAQQDAALTRYEDSQRANKWWKPLLGAGIGAGLNFLTGGLGSLGGMSGSMTSSSGGGFVPSASASDPIPMGRFLSPGAPPWLAGLKPGV